jgi:hypothetical protein
MNMQFVNARQQYNNYNKLQYPNNNLIPFTRRLPTQISNSQSEVKTQPQTVSKNDPKKIKWGRPTWFLFHTLADKIKYDQFPILKNELINNIVLICKNLPCPTCASHASDYMSKINLNAIRTKDDLKNMLFKFHNDVNTRTGSPQFSYDELNDKYSNAVTINIIQNFFVHFQTKSFNVTEIANNMHRSMAIDSLKKWLLLNISNFNP